MALGPHVVAQLFSQVFPCLCVGMNSERGSQMGAQVPGFPQKGEGGGVGGKPINQNK